MPEWGDVALLGLFAVRLWSPEWSVAGVAVHRVLRWAAWGGTVVSLLLLVWPRLAAR